ncbi:MAG: hypothetical protein GY810_17145 [Aureispira sp.]|nr:hypothetical protein [Aureispira sp.]
MTRFFTFLVAVFLVAQLPAQTIDLSNKYNHLSFEKNYAYSYLSDYYKDNEDNPSYLINMDWEALQQQLNEDPSIETIDLYRYTDIDAYALWIHLLNDDSKSVFYNQKAQCLERAKKLFPKKEQEQFLLTLAKLDTIKQGGDNDVLWALLLTCAVTEEQHQRFSEYWVKTAKESKKARDIENIEILMAYDLGHYYYSKIGSYPDENFEVKAKFPEMEKKALSYYQKWYELRKKNKGYIAAAYVELSNLYTKMNKHEEAYALWEDYDKIYTESGGKDEYGWHAAKFRMALHNLARYHDVDKAIEVFEQDYLKPKKVYVEDGGIWEDAIPYTWAVTNSEKVKDQIKYMKAWATALQKYTNKRPLAQANAVIELLNRQNYIVTTEETQKLYIQYFEELYLANLVKAKPVEGSGVYSETRSLKSWVFVVPYEKMIDLLIAKNRQAELEQWYQKWLEAAVKTENEKIIRTTFINVFKRLGKEKNEELAEKFFIKYYCERLSTESAEDNAVWEIYNEWPYRWMEKKDADKQAQRWVELAKEHASSDLFAWVLGYAASHTGFHGDKEWTMQYLLQRLVLVKYHKQIDLISDSYIDLITLNRSLNNYPLALQYTIEDYLFDKENDLKPRYSRLSSFHTIVSACLKKSEITMKDKKNMKKQLKKLKKKLQKEADKHAELLDWIDKNIAYFDF